MSVNLSPLGVKPQFEGADGLPAVGNKLFFYVAGSIGTKQNTYTDSNGFAPNTNPIVLNSLGNPTTQIWFKAGQSYKVVYAPSTDTDPPTSPIWTVDNIVGINDTTVAVSEWQAGPFPTYIGATSFSLDGDQRSTFQINRRVQTTNTSGTVYSTISNSTYGGAITTVTVLNDSTTLDSGLSAVNYALLNASNPSVPAQYVKTDGSGNITLANNSALQWKDSGGTARRSFLLSGGNAYFIGDVDNAGYNTTIRGRSALEFDINASPVMALSSAGAVVTGVTNSTTGFQYNGTALPIQRKSNIGDQVITSAGPLLLAHGLTLVETVDAQLVCQTGEAGYTAGLVTPTPTGALITSGAGLSILWDGTNITVRYSSTANAFIAPHATTGVQTVLTNGNWKLRLIARGT